MNHNIIVYKNEKMFIKFVYFASVNPNRILSMEQFIEDIAVDRACWQTAMNRKVENEVKIKNINNARSRKWSFYKKIVENHNKVVSDYRLRDACYAAISEKNTKVTYHQTSYCKGKLCFMLFPNLANNTPK